jgi:hypothetical protein
MKSASGPPYFKAWLLFFVIASAGGALVGGMAGLFLGVALALANVGPGTIKLSAAVLGFVLGMPISYFAFKWVVSQFIVKGDVVAPPVIEGGPPQSAAPADAQPPQL